MSLRRLCALFFAIGLLFCCACACRAQDPAFCRSKKETIQVDIPFPDMPVSISEHGILSTIETYGSFLVTNEASVGIEELDIQIEYTRSHGELVGILHFGAFALRPEDDYPVRTYFTVQKQSLAPGDSITLFADSLRVFTLCPDKARLTAIRVRFSDGTEFLRTASPWIFQEITHRMRSQLPKGSVPAQNSVYLLQLTISATGEVQEVRQLKSGSAVLSTVVIDELRKWRLPPLTRDGQPEASKILAVLRIIREGSGCDEYTCPIPFPRGDLSPAFVLIDLEHTSITAPARHGFEAFDVFFGEADVGDIW